MMTPALKPWILLAPLLLAACATVPKGPSVMVLPGSNKSFDQFRSDDFECQRFAFEQTGTTAADAQVESGVRSAAVGTVVGAAAGAAIGGHRGAGVGAGTGLLIGSAAGAGAAERSAYNTQQQYDVRYMQCMYAKGHRIPVRGKFTSTTPRPPSPAYPPPPPPSR